MHRVNQRNNTWSIILAGGDGKRLKPFVRRWLGCDKPKQYCCFVGTRSMLEHTLDRSDQITAPERKVTIITRAHRVHAWPQLAKYRGTVLVQPANCETAPGIFLGLAHVLAHDPGATLMVFPSDHFVYPEHQFLRVARKVNQAAERLKRWLFVLGVRPDEIA